MDEFTSTERDTEVAENAYPRLGGKIRHLEDGISRLRAGTTLVEKERDTARRDVSKLKKEMAELATKAAEVTKKLQAEVSGLNKNRNAMQAKHEKERGEDHAASFENTRTMCEEAERLILENRDFKKMLDQAEENLSNKSGDSKENAALFQNEPEEKIPASPSTIERNGELDATNLNSESDSEDARSIHQLKEDLKAVIDRCKILEEARERCVNARAERTDYVDDRERTLKRAAYANGKLLEEVRYLDIKVKDLEEDISNNKPLVQIAVHIRMRFLAQARGIIIENSADRENALFRLGKAAAHRSNGKVDEAMFMSGLVEDADRWEQVFVELYGKRPGHYGDMPEGLRRVIDCDASLRSCRPGGQGVADLRRKTGESITQLSIQCAVEEEVSNERENDLKCLEVWTATIIKMERHGRF